MLREFVAASNFATGTQAARSRSWRCRSAPRGHRSRRWTGCRRLGCRGRCSAWREHCGGLGRWARHGDAKAGGWIMRIPHGCPWGLLPVGRTAQMGVLAAVETADFRRFFGRRRGCKNGDVISLTRPAAPTRKRLPTPRRLAPDPETGCSLTSKSGIGRDTLAASFIHWA